MGLREPAAADTERVREVVESAMTASYRLSPQQIERVVAEEFDEAAVAEKRDDDEVVVQVAETAEDLESETVVGYAEGGVDGDAGELRWLFVDPEHRGKDVGTELFEATRNQLEAAGASTLRATALDANTDGGQFFERFGLERADERNVTYGDESLVAVVYAESGGDERAAEGEATDNEQLPGTQTTDGETTATSGDGETVFVARDERESGTDAPFFVAYADDGHAERFGYYCANCGSLDVAMDDAERLACSECGNEHASRSSDGYDDSYL
jgi:GNAT superfamily N-acetyltransferase